MAGADSLKEGHGIAPANLAQDDPIRPHAQRGRQEHIGAARISVPVREQRYVVGLLGAQLGRFLDGDNPFLGRDQRQDLARSNRLAGRGAARAVSYTHLDVYKRQVEQVERLRDGDCCRCRQTAPP